jgi:hypothetical protein
MDAEEAWLVPLIQDADGRMVETWAMECRNGLYYTTDKSVSKTTVAVEYGPQLVGGPAIFFAFKLGVSDIYSKALPTIALQKTSTRKATTEDMAKGAQQLPLAWIQSRTSGRESGLAGRPSQSTSTGSRIGTDAKLFSIIVCAGALRLAAVFQ